MCPGGTKFDRLRRDTARGGGRPGSSRCHRSKALGEIYKLRRLPEPDSAVSGGSRARNAREPPVRKFFDGLPKDTARDGWGLRRSRCHRFEALGEIYNLRRPPDSENINKQSKIISNINNL